MYRAQLAYQTQPGMKDVHFTYNFDGYSVPQLSGTILNGAKTGRIPLRLQQDAPFIWRGTLVQGTILNSGGSPGGGLPLRAQFVDPYGNYLSDALLPLNNTVAPSGIAVVGELLVPLEPEILCPTGGVIYLYLQNDSGSTQPLPSVSLYGVKRYQEACGRAA